MLLKLALFLHVGLKSGTKYDNPNVCFPHMLLSAFFFLMDRFRWKKQNMIIILLLTKLNNDFHFHVIIIVGNDKFHFSCRLVSLCRTEKYLLAS